MSKTGYAELEEAFHAKEREVLELQGFIHAQSNTIEALKQRVTELNFEIVNRMAANVAAGQMPIPDTLEGLEDDPA